jgi:pSer/pThr/pTyr-binding forkhead associated (FHA) protein
VPTGGALLTVVSGELEADYFVLTGEEAYIGRSPESSVLLDDVTVSRQHAKITRDDKGWLITDLRSLNGTYLNKERVDSGALSDGDELQIGKFRFVFVVPEVTSG